MKLYLAEGSLECGKVFCASKISPSEVETEFVKSNDGRFFNNITNTLPLLEVDKYNNVFSANAIVKFLLNHEPESASQLTEIDQISEYEITFIKPLVNQVAAGTVGPEKGEHKLQEQVYLVVAHVKDLIPPEVNAGSIILWFSLFPLLYPASLFRNYLSDQHKQVVAWFDKLQNNPHFSQSISQVLPDLSWNSVTKQLSMVNLQASLSLSKAPSDNHHQHPPPLLHHTASVSPSNESGSTKQSSKGPAEKDLKTAAEMFVAVDESLLKKQRPRPLLPDHSDRNILVTSALPYVNNVPHLGNIIGCVLSADVYSRYCRLKDYNTLFICGTDEYGTATETKALEEKLTPMQICDKYNRLHTEVYEWFNIGFDKFGRTTNQHQCKIAQDIFWDLHNNKYICKQTVEQLYCQNCEKFLADRFAEGQCPFCAYPDARGDQCDKCGKLINAVELKNPRCKLCAHPPTIRQSQHLFLDLPKLEPLLTAHLDRAMEKGVWSTNAKTITKSWIRDGLKARCVSRDLKWGTPVPLEGYTDKVFYVWYDAPIGYISITAEYTDQWKKWWQNPDHVELYNFMAKDNVPFHSVIFPSTLLGTHHTWTLVNSLCSTEYLNYEDSKFSKSRGVGVFGNNAAEAGIPADIFRFYLLFIRPESQDTVFSWDDLKQKNNSELLNNLGNFVNRALSFIKSNFSGVIQEVTLQGQDKDFLASVNLELNNYTAMMEQVRLRDGLRCILSISSLGNQYIQTTKPWVLIKGDPTEKARAGCISSLAANVVCLISILLHPFMPTTSLQLLTQLNHPHALNYKLTNHVKMNLKAGHVIGEVTPPFQKIEACVTDELKKKFSGKQEKSENASDDMAMNEGELLAMIEKQGNKVRDLKVSKADKDIVQKEVEVLLKFKASLNQLMGVPQGTGKAVKTGNKKKGKK